MSSQAPPAPPVFFDTPTLGRSARLGELYDVRSGKFLGVQLYPQDKIKQVETDIRHTDLTLTHSTTYYQKAALLDINDQLSLDVLSGLVKVSGSASYLNDKKSNTNVYAYALALKMRLREERILFAEVAMGREVLPIVEHDYIETKLATHFVSSIAYGGNYIVNLVARQTGMTKEKIEEGKLWASLEKLKGAIRLGGSVGAKVKEEFIDMDEKFDLIVHGDIALEKVPITPKDVLDTFPEAASFITNGGGIPITVTLQPIPPDLYKGDLIHQIREDLVDGFLSMFSDLDDFRNRLLVLQDNARRSRDFIPELVRTIGVVTIAYIKEHSQLLRRLKKYLQECKQGKNLDEVALYMAADALHKRHFALDNKSLKVPPEYPSTLVGLEDQHSRFQCLVADIRRVRESLNPPKPVDPGMPRDENKQNNRVMNRSFHFSTLEDICRAIRSQSETLLFIMTPISSDESSHELTTLEYLAIVRKYATYFEGSTNTAHMFYAENPDKLERRLCNGGKFSGLKAPAVFTARVDDDGKLTWHASPSICPPPTPLHSLPLIHTPNNGNVGTVALNIDGVNSKKNLTLQIRAKEGSGSAQHWSYIILLLDQTGHWFLSFRKGFGVALHEKGLDIKSRGGKKPESGKEFLGTFVQDVREQQWTLYLDGDEIARESFTEKDLFPYGEKLQISYWGSGWWDGQLLEFNAFARALNKEEVKDLYLAWKNGQN